MLQNVGVMGQKPLKNCPFSHFALFLWFYSHISDILQYFARFLNDDQYLVHVEVWEQDLIGRMDLKFPECSLVEQVDLYLSLLDIPVSNSRSS